MNFEFMTIDTPLPPCMPFPRALTGFPVSSTAKVMYCRMLDAMLSKGQEDENGILFVCFPVTAIEEMQERVNAATARYHELGDSIKAAEQRMTEIAVLRAHIVNYAKTRSVYDAYRKAGYSKKFLEQHREQITLHKAAKVAFDEAGLKKLPKVKELNVEYAELLAKKKSAYPEYRKARDEIQELMKAQKNVELFFAEEKEPKEKSQTR